MTEQEQLIEVLANRFACQKAQAVREYAKKATSWLYDKVAKKRDEAAQECDRLLRLCIDVTNKNRAKDSADYQSFRNIMNAHADDAAEIAATFWHAAIPDDEYIKVERKEIVYWLTVFVNDMRANMLRELKAEARARAQNKSKMLRIRAAAKKSTRNK